MINWKDSIHSEVNEDYMSNPSPSLGDTVQISFKAFRDSPIDSAELRVIICGHSERIEMNITRSNSLFHWWTGILKITQTEMIHWHFLLHCKEGELFYTRSAVESVNPTEDHDFTLLPGFKSPDWVNKAVFYQIFPDRFSNGDQSCNRIENEYNYDGAGPKIMKWDDDPLEFSEGRCMDFFNGDLKGIQNKIPYLKDLGVTAIYITPIFKAKTTHRYDCTDYFHVDEALGGDQALAELTEELHKNDMKLVVDVSINHTGSNHLWFNKAIKDSDSREAKYYFPDGKGGFECWWDVPTLPQLNYNAPELRETIIEGEDSLVKHWLREPWKIDGWRFDVGNQVGRRENSQLGFQLWKDIRKAVKDENPQAYILGEHWEDAIAYQLGDQWDGAMNYFACGSPLRRWAGEAVRFEASGPDYPPHKTRKYTGYELEKMIRQHYDRIPSQMTGLQLNVLDTHDIHRFHNNEELFDWNIYKGMIYLQFLLPGAPNIWYGDEIGLKGHVNSVEGCRFPMEWSEDKWNEGFQTLYKTLANLKKEESALQYGGYKILFRDEMSLVFARFNKDKVFLAILNKNESAGIFRFPLSIIGPCLSLSDLFGDRSIDVINGYCEFQLKEKENLLLWGHLMD